jgi:hypothetical protein
MGSGRDGVGLFGLAGAVVTHQVHLLEVALFIFGAGFGVFTFGGLSLMAVMASDKEAGAYLGLWSIAIVVSKGLARFWAGWRGMFAAGPGRTGRPGLCSHFQPGGTWPDRCYSDPGAD